MNFLQQFQKLEPKVIYDGGDRKIVDINGKQVISDTNKVIILPYFVQKGGILLRYENLPEFEISQKGITTYLTALSATLQKDVDINNVIKQALIDKFGIKIYNDSHINICEPIFLTPGQTTKYTFVYVLLYDGQFEEIEVSDYQRIEFKDKNAFVSTSNIKNCIIYDLVTKYCIDYLKSSELFIF